MRQKRKPAARLEKGCRGFPGGIVDENRLCNAGDTGLIPAPGRFHMLWSN